MKTLGRRSIASIVTFLLNAAWGLVALGLALAILLLPLSAVVSGSMEVDGSWLMVGSTTMKIPVSLTMDERVTHLAAPSIGGREAELQDIQASLKFPARRDAFFVANAVMLIVVFALWLWILGQLRAVFRTLRAGRPFVAANAVRLRRVAFGVIAGDFAHAAIVFFENSYAMKHFTAGGLHFVARPDVNIMTIVVGLIILVIAEVFREGTRLDEEQSLTV